MSEEAALYGDQVNIPAKMAELRERARREEPAVIASEIAKLFPDLRRAPGVDPWNPAALDLWAMSDAMGANSKPNVRFVLSLWSGGDGDNWKVGTFTLFDVKLLDGTGFKVVQAWFANPFWL